MMTFKAANKEIDARIDRHNKLHAINEDGMRAEHWTAAIVENGVVAYWTGARWSSVEKEAAVFNYSDACLAASNDTRKPLGRVVVVAYDLKENEKPIPYFHLPTDAGKI